MRANDAVVPTSPRELGVAVVNGIGKDGKPKAGLALDFAPWKLLAPMTTREQVQNDWTRLLGNTQLSIGIVGLGLLSAGGSSMWNSVLTYLLSVKDLKRAEAVQAKQEAFVGAPPRLAPLAAMAPPTRASAS